MSVKLFDFFLVLLLKGPHCLLGCLVESFGQGGQCGLFLFKDQVGMDLVGRSDFAEKMFAL